MRDVPFSPGFYVWKKIAFIQPFSSKYGADILHHAASHDSNCLVICLASLESKKVGITSVLLIIVPPEQRLLHNDI